MKFDISDDLQIAQLNLSSAYEDDVDITDRMASLSGGIKMQNSKD